MSRFSTIVWVLVVVVAAFLLYQVKYEVQNVRAELAEKTLELEVERESLRVVTAEWAYLNRPDRLRQLAQKYLSSDGVMVQQIAEVEAIPFPQRLEAANGDAGAATPVSMAVMQAQ